MDQSFSGKEKKHVSSLPEWYGVGKVLEPSAFKMGLL